MTDMERKKLEIPEIRSDRRRRYRQDVASTAGAISSFDPKFSIRCGGECYAIVERLWKCASRVALRLRHTGSRDRGGFQSISYTTSRGYVG